MGIVIAIYSIESYVIVFNSMQSLRKKDFLSNV